MATSKSTSIATLKDTILALEAQRSILGDAVVDASIAALQHQIAELQAQAEPIQQRKLVTILFMDVVGSTFSISTRLDPEDTLEIMDQSLKRLALPIEKHGGHVTRFMGDGFMAIFGSPVARENDAEMAIRAGLDIISEAGLIAEELHVQWHIPSFQVRVGINTGLVALGGVTEAEDTIMGGMVNLAARLENAAPPGGVLISHDTYQHVCGLFIMDPQEPIVVKGFDEPIQAYLVKSARHLTFQTSTRGVEGIETRMIGRQEELETLQGVLNRLMCNAQGRSITIVGDAGVGKSRLLYEFLQHVEQLPEKVTQYLARARQESYHQPYGLLRDLFTRFCQIHEDDLLETVREKIEGRLTKLTSSQESHLIGQLLGFDFENSPYILDLQDDAQGLHDHGLRALDEYFRLACQESPCLLFLEDIHWADDSSLDYICNLIRKAVHFPLLIISLARPVIFERQPDWGKGQDGHLCMNLMALSRSESQQLVEDILKKVDHIPDDLQELIVSGAEGNPFYIEELIKMLIESGAIIKGEECWQIEVTRLTQMNVPSTLTGVLQARLDSLPPAERLLLQEASVIGRTFWERMLTYLHAAEADMQANINVTLESLQKKELVFKLQESAFAGISEYIFKHAMLRDVTYESVLKRKRRTIHAHVAQWLTEYGAERIGEYSGLIADHLERAGQNIEAVGYLIQAGEQAARQYANREAVSYFSRALALTPETDLETRYQLFFARECVLDIQGLRKPQAEDLSTMKLIADALDDIHKQAHVALRQVLYFNHTGNFPASLEMMEEAIQVAQQAGDVRCEGALQMQWGIALWRQGKYASAQPTLEQALDMAKDAHLDTIAGDGIRTLGPAFVRILADKQSSTRFELALEKYHQAGDRRGEAYTLNNLGQYHAEFKDNLTKAKEYYQQALTIWQEIGDRRNEGLTVFNLGLNAARNSEYEKAGHWFSNSLEIRREVGDKWGERISQSLLGECLLHLGDYGSVLDHYRSALAISQEIGDLRGETTLHQLLGNFYRELGNYERAKSYYDQVLQAWVEFDQPQDRARFLLDLCLMLHQSGRDQEAFERWHEAEEYIATGDDPDLEWMALIVQGHIQVTQGKLNEAELAYKKATAKAAKRRRQLQEFESATGIARILLARDQHPAAILCIEKLLAHIQKIPASGTQSPLDGAIEPLRMYLTCWQVLYANQDRRAADVLRQAYDLLQARAAVISDEKLRASYLDDVPVHHQILKVYQA